MSVVALVPAAGAGMRLGAAEPKAFVLLRGVPLVVHAVQGLLRSGFVDGVVVAVPGGELCRAQELLGDTAIVLAGGTDRTGSVRLALDEALRQYPSAEVVLVHDAARALTPPALVRDVVAAVRSGAGAVVPVLPVADTVKRVDGRGRVTGTADRAELRTVQTPQGFATTVLRRAYAAWSVGQASTDDAGLVEALPEPVHTVAGHPLAFKITTRWDLELAERLL